MQILSLLLTATVLQAAPGDTLFVQASALNLRTQPKANAPLRMQVPIGSACTVKSLTPDGWAELTCTHAQGFGKLELLGPQAPDAAVLLAQGQEPGRPLSEAINLLQRAVTLKPSDEPTRRAFRDLYWKAEFDRLARARAANTTLKTPQEVRWPQGCGAPDACVKAALKPEAGGVWDEVRLQGTDVVSAQLFSDGLFQLRSGGIDPGQRTVTVQLESLTLPGAAVLGALGVKGDIEDACEPTVNGEDNNGADSTCGYSFDQSCAPDDCATPRDTCMQEASDRCGECKSTCANTCGSCRLKCGTTDRKGCVERCLAATRACEATCQRPADAVYATCNAQYASCSAAEERVWKQKCEKPCSRMDPCVERCNKEHHDQRDENAWQCIAQCGKKVKLPESCNDRCFFRFQ